MASLKEVRIKLQALILGLLAVGALAAAGGAQAASQAASNLVCAGTSDPNTPSMPSPGVPCWTTDVTRYPFGVSGTSIDLSSGSCASSPFSCALVVNSMAFRSWNRGLAAVSGQDQNGNQQTTPYGVWVYNGQNWFPNPAFPGGSVCNGDTILWAGKLDYWLVGENQSLSVDNLGGGENWPPLCRFDGANYEWERLPIPKATLAEVDSTNGVPRPGGINAGACFAWNDCWFFGTYGTVVHWDGQSLSNVSVGLGSSPWLEADYTAAIARTDAAGNEFGFAVAASTTGDSVADGDWGVGGQLGQAVTAPPDGSAPPQLFASFGGAFAPLGFTPSTSPVPSGTDLVALDFNTAGEGWVAGNPRDSVLPQAGQPAEPAPLVPITSGGTERCTPPEFSASASGDDSYLWSSISVFPDGDVLAGGKSLEPGTSHEEPVLVDADASCGSASVTRFRVPDPTPGAPPLAPLVPADGASGITSVAANASNDAWAATSGGTFPPGSTTSPVYQPPYLYHWTDPGPVLAPAGNDYEPRPVTQSADPIQYVVSPPVVVPPPPAPTTETKVEPETHETIHLKAPIYAIGHHLDQATLTLYITFKVRANVTIGVEAFFHRELVSSSGLRHFRAGSTGQLSMRLELAKWPTRIAFVQPKTKAKA